MRGVVGWSGMCECVCVWRGLCENVVSRKCVKVGGVCE